MTRRIATLTAAASLLLCLAALALCWRSARGVDVLIAPTRAGDRWLVTSEFGVLVVEHQDLQPLGPGEPRPGWQFFTDRLPRRFPGHWRRLGFDAYRDTARHFVLLPPVATRGVVVPYWFVVLLTATPPAWWLGRARRRAAARDRGRAGLCEACGYDLRASPSRCPECGTAVRAAPAV